MAIDMSSWEKGGGGVTGGIAQGQIRIDTHSLALSRAQVIREARLMADGMRSIGDAADKGVKQADNAFTRLSATLNSTYRTTSLLMGVISTMGVKSAQSVKVLEARFALLAGSQQKANEQLAELRKLSKDLNQPFLDMVEGATAIMPALRGTNASLKDTIMLVQRLAILDPAQGVSGAAFAIREFLNGEYLSLVRRLELDRKRLMAIRDEANGDQAKMIEGLSQYIDEIGLTNEQLQAMGKEGLNTFQVLRSEGTETLAVFFEPFLNDVIIPLTRAFGDFLRELRKTSPELQKFIGIAGGLASVSAIGQNGLPLIGKIPGGALLGKAGVYGAALYGGAQLGGYIARKAGIGEAEGKSQSEVMNLAWDRLKQVMFLLAYGLGQLVKVAVNIAEAIDNAWDDVKAAWDRVTDGLGKIWDKLDEFAGKIGIDLSPEPKSKGSTGWEKGKDYGYGSNWTMGVYDPKAWVTEEEFDAGKRPGQITLPLGNTGYLPGYQPKPAGKFGGPPAIEADPWEEARKAIDDFYVTLGKDMGVIDETGEKVGILTAAFQRMSTVVQGVIAGAAANEPTITDELLAGYQQFKDDMAQLEREANEAILEENEQYEERRAELIRSYSESVTSFLEEEAVRYERALADAQRRESDIRTTLAETLADASTELAKSVADLNEDYQREQERATRDHLARLRDIQRDGKENILKAAAKLDGQGVWEALRTMQRRKEDEKDSFARQERDRREQLAQALEDEKENYAERVQAAKDHAEQQIRQLWEQFSREEQVRREDNARRIADMQAAHQKQLSELQNNHRNRLEEIRRQFALEKAERQKQWLAQWNAAQTHQNTMLGIQVGGQQKMENELRAWWERMKGIVSGQAALTEDQYAAKPPSGGDLPGVPTRHSGGRLTRSGLFKGLRDEEVLRPDVARTLRRMMGGEISQSDLVAAYGRDRGNGGTRSITTGDWYIQIPADVTDREELGAFVQTKVLEVLRASA